MGTCGQCVAWEEHLGPRRACCGILLLSESTVETDYVDGVTVENAVRKVLDTFQALKTGDTAADDSDVGVVQSYFEL